jgi:AcrR family transcriptional regulator
MGAGDHIKRVHTDWSVGTITRIAKRKTPGSGGVLPGARRGRLDGRTRDARARGREARDELLSAALRVFARRGYRDASVEEIAAEAGYSKGALYWHFSSKEELLNALLDERVDAPLRDAAALLSSAPVELDMSVEAATVFAQQLQHQRDALVLESEYRALALRDPDLRTRYKSRQGALRQGLAAALATRASHLGAPAVGMSADDLARIVMSIVSGLAADELVEPGSVHPELLSEALAVIYAGLVARADSLAQTDPRA